jgi:hypothetical protein
VLKLHSSFLSDPVRFEKTSLIERMHCTTFGRACADYEELGGDAFIYQSGADVDMTHSIYKRLEIAREIVQQQRESADWAQLGKQQLSDGGIQFFCIFKSMFDTLRPEFLKLPTQDASLDAMSIRELLTKRPTQMEALAATLRTGGVDEDGTFDQAMQLCCSAITATGRRRVRCMEDVCTIGGLRSLYPLNTCKCAHLCLLLFRTCAVDGTIVHLEKKKATT